MSDIKIQYKKMGDNRFKISLNPDWRSRLRDRPVAFNFSWEEGELKERPSEKELFEALLIAERRKNEARETYTRKRNPKFIAQYVNAVTELRYAAIRLEKHLKKELREQQKVWSRYSITD